MTNTARQTVTSTGRPHSSQLIELVDLYEKRQANVPLTRSDWYDLACRARRAYARSPRDRHYYRADLLQDVIRALKALLTLRNELCPDCTHRDDRLNIRRLADGDPIPFDREPASLSRLDTRSIQEAADSAIDYLGTKPITTVAAHFVVDDLLATLDFGPDMDEIAIDRVLGPYFSSLFQLAAYDFRQSNQHRVAWTPSDYDFEGTAVPLDSPIRHESTAATISICPLPNDYIVFLTLQRRNITLNLVSRRFEDLAHAFSYAIPSESAGGFTVIRRGTKSQISNSILMVSLTPTETSSVDECLAFYRSDEAIQGLRLGAMMKWGSL